MDHVNRQVIVILVVLTMISLHIDISNDDNILVQNVKIFLFYTLDFGMKD